MKIGSLYQQLIEAGVYTEEIQGLLSEAAANGQSYADVVTAMTELLRDQQQQNARDREELDWLNTPESVRDLINDSTQELTQIGVDRDLILEKIADARRHGVSYEDIAEGLSDLILEVKQEIWKKQQQISELQVRILELERIATDGSYPDVVRRNFRNTAAELRKQLLKLELSLGKTADQLSGTAATGLSPVAYMPFNEKLAKAVEYAIASGELSNDVAAKLKAFTDPANAAKMAGMMGLFIGAYAGSHLIGVGVVLDVYFIADGGKEAALALQRIYLDVADAVDESDLRGAGTTIAKELSGPIADVIFEQLLKYTAKGAGKGFAKAARSIDFSKIQMNIKGGPAGKAWTGFTEKFAAGWDRIFGRRNGRGNQQEFADEAEEIISDITGVPRNHQGSGEQTIPGTGNADLRVPDLRVRGRNGSVRIRGSVVEVKASRGTKFGDLSQRSRNQIRDSIAYVRRLRARANSVTDPNTRNLLQNAHVEVFSDLPAPTSGRFADLIEEGILIWSPIPR